MNRKKFLGITGVSMSFFGALYLDSDRSSLIRKNMKIISVPVKNILPDEREILSLASLAPSGHNTQPWFVKYKEPYHWTIGNDRSRWLPAVDPDQRETILSIGAFIQNLEFAASNLGYACKFNVVASKNQDEEIVDVILFKSENLFKYDVNKIINRRTIRSNILDIDLKSADLVFLMSGEDGFFHFFPKSTPESDWINEKTIEANELQSFRDPAQKELSNWIRFSSKDAVLHQDGLTTASMEITGLPAWILRNFYGKSNVMKKGFRVENINHVKTQVSHSAGWMVISSKDNSLQSLIDTGKRLQRLFLRVREKMIALHPMTQILEEPSIKVLVSKATGIQEPIQFILRIGYLENYPDPVSLRRPVDMFLRM